MSNPRREPEEFGAFDSDLVYFGQFSMSVDGYGNIVVALTVDRLVLQHEVYVVRGACVMWRKADEERG
jgi:hypothetical protein